MDVSRISRGKIELRRERVLLVDVLASAVETSRPLIEQMGHVLTVALPQHPLGVEVDFTRMAQVLLNLLNNAAKYSERNGRIWLTCEQQGDEVVVSVKDAGVGIPVDQLARVFDMFAQVDHSLQKSQGGLGIGLCLVKRIVELHGGRVEARSQGPGTGSEFIVWLPVVVESSASHGDAERPNEAKTAHRILIVDDSRDIAESLATMLRMLGNETCTAYDGEAALAAAQDFRPDVVMLDIGLPNMDGYEACRRIRELGPGREMVIIAQTGWGQEAALQRTHDAGFDHHLVKPVDPRALMQLLRSQSKRGAAGRA
jgi:CheY-like chemotaxis protein/anti-sigma regulatory factor (Ser/Thr protein kinase)